MYRFDADECYETLIKEVDDQILANPKGGEIARDFNRLLSERMWELHLTPQEWELLGSVARGGEASQTIPDVPELWECHGVMRWALGVVRGHTDYKFQGIDASKADGIWLLHDHPLGIKEKWSNEFYIAGTMYTANGQKMLMPGPGHVPDPDWRLILPRARQFLLDNATRVGPVPEIISAAIEEFFGTTGETVH